MNRIARLTLALGLGIVGMLAVLLLLTTSVQPAAHAAGNTIHVPDDYATIQAAIDAATDGDTILVAEGLYKENLSITEGITLSGGWNITFTARTPGWSIIDAEGMGRVISITCASSDTVVTIDGFTIAGGDATGQGGFPTALGKGDWFQGASPPAELASDDRAPAERVADLRARLADIAARGLYPGGEAAYQATLARIGQLIAQAEAADRSRPAETDDAALQTGDCGGGVYSWNASLHLLNCTLEDNIASMTGSGFGGGVFAGQAAPGGMIIAGNALHDNIASTSNVPLAEGVGGALYVCQAPGAVIADNMIHENAASSGGLLGVGVGGGLAVEDSLSALVRGNQIARNTAGAGWEIMSGVGGGAYLRNVSGATVTDNVFRENVGVLYGAGGSGGLIVVVSQDVLVADNTVIGNWGCVIQPDRTNVSGGGISLMDMGTAVTVTGNAVWSNVASLSGPMAGDSFGGGIDCQALYDGIRITSNTITGNVACQSGIGWGGGVSFWAVLDGVVADNVLTDNAGSLSGEGGGGGVFLRNTDRSLVYHNRFQGNQGAGEGDGSGGGLRVEGQGPYSFNATVDANLFLDNRACVQNPSGPSIGGACIIGTDGFTFTNNVVVDNTADLGGGVALEYAPRGVVVNNTLVGNGDTGVMVDQYTRAPITFTNNIVVSHTVGISVTEGATATVRYTLWHGNGTDIAGSGTITHTHPVIGPPAFADPAADDYHLTPASAARDAGDPAGVPPAPPVDRDGVARPQGLGVDIGAYEWQGHQLYLPLAMKDWRAYTGWAVGDSADGYGTILRTTDSGNTWQRQGRPGEVPDIHLDAVSAVDANNAWVVGGDVILRTRDGGLTWERQALPAGLPPDVDLSGIKAIDGNTAWAVGGPEEVLLQTTDGHTWSVMPRGADLYFQFFTRYNDVDAADATHVWAVGSHGLPDNPLDYRGEIVIAFYDGVQWHRQGTEVIPEHGDCLIGVSVLDEDTVWAVGGPALPLVKTTDGGASWQQVGPPDGLNPFDTNQVVAVTADTGWVACDSGSMKRTDDGGQSWTSQEVGTSDYLYGITAIDTQTVWAVSVPYYPWEPGHLLRTRDGQHWEVRPSPVEAALWGISFVGARR